MIIVAGVSYRCGTTLIQRLINTSDECLIYGEDNGILSTADRYISFISKSMDRSKKQWENFNKNKDTFTANLLRDMNDYIDGFSFLIDSLYGGCGFKVLSPTEKDIDVLNVLANAKIVLMYRNLNDSWKSYQNIYGYISRENFFKNFERSRTLLKKSLRGDYGNVYPMKYEDLSEDSVNTLFDWLGINNRKMIPKVLSNRIVEMDSFCKNSTNYLKRN